MERTFDYSIIFYERTPFWDWDNRKYQIAEFIAMCRDSYDTDEAWRDYCKKYGDRQPAKERTIDDRSYEYKSENSYFDLFSTDEFWNGCGLDAVKEGLRERFPDIDYEYHRGIASDAPYSVDIIISKDGKEYCREYFIDSLVDYLDWYEPKDLLKMFNTEIQTELSTRDYVIMEDEGTEPWSYYLINRKSSPLIENIIQELITTDKYFAVVATKENPYPIPSCVIEYNFRFYPPIPAWFSIKR